MIFVLFSVGERHSKRMKNENDARTRTDLLYFLRGLEKRALNPKRNDHLLKQGDLTACVCDNKNSKENRSVALNVNRMHTCTSCAVRSAMYRNGPKPMTVRNGN